MNKKPNLKEIFQAQQIQPKKQKNTPGAAPLPKSEKSANPPEEKEAVLILEHKPKLLGKIQLEKRRTQDDFSNKNNENYNLNQDTDIEEYEMKPIKAHLSFDEGNDERNENEANVSNKKESKECNIQDERFNKITKHIYNTEGGFVDDPDDRGGRTNKGVTQRAFDAYNKKHGLPLKDVKDITEEEATEFYKKEYWEASGADKIKDKNLAYMHYDAAINHGVGTAKKFLRRSEDDFNKYYELRRTLYDNLAKNPNSKNFTMGG